MERSSLCRNLKQQQHTINKSITSFKNLQEDYNKVNKGASSWDFHINDYNNNGSEEGDLMMASAGFSWPPRSYTCSFCKREFRSAQALGGHMNVHRRDRARLRQSPPTDHNNSSCNHNNNPSTNHGQFPLLNLNLGPNPSLNSNPSLTSKSQHFTSTLLTQKLSPLSANKMTIRPLTSDLLRTSVPEKRCDVVKKGEESVRLDLEIGMISQNKEELDLELRLGYV